MRRLSTVLAGGAFFESPRWHDGRWWVSDISARRVLAVAPSGDAEEVMRVDGQPSGLGWMPDGSLLAVSMTDRRVLRRSSDGDVVEHADLSGLAADCANDMVVDAHGRAYVGTFGFDLYGGAEPAPATLVRVDPDGTTSVAATDLWFPNGAVIAPGGRTLIVGESAAARYTAFDIDDDGGLVNRRVWAQLAPEPGRGSPAELVATLELGIDGCALDAAGHIWVADSIVPRCLRIAEGGEIVEQLDVPDGLGVFACMLGGDDGRTLLLCAAPAVSAQQTAGGSGGAVLLATTVDVPHAGLP